MANYPLMHHTNETEEVFKVVGYVRISEEDRIVNKQTSIDNQMTLIKDFCLKRKWNLVQIYEDRNLSGGDRFRKGFTDMVRGVIKSTEVIFIVVKDQDRFARDTGYFIDTLKDLEAHGKKVFSIMKNDYLSQDDLGDVVKAVVDAQYIIRSRKETKQVYENKKEEGLPPFRAPYGYECKNKQWVLDRRKAKKVQIVCEDYINGVRFKETTFNLSIAKALYYRIIQNALNEIYTGDIFYLNKVKDSLGKVVRVEPVRYKGKHNPIISDYVQSKIIEKYKTHPQYEYNNSRKKAVVGE
ncbi:hypothetical protein CMI42_01945 [Candidatus Pacearchaeota archaeon]|nr:hypothetical protein [Candidatus Pacearchaeota archaeon]|tara:strand:+ start:978 stop:1865 length:888 start_codon:yes stop_codon:yes gene_type:complete